MLAYISMSAELALSWCMGLLQAMKLPLERLGDNQDPEPLQRALTCGLFLHAARRQPDGTCSAGLDTPPLLLSQSSGGPGPQASIGASLAIGCPLPWVMWKCFLLIKWGKMCKEPSVMPVMGPRPLCPTRPVDPINAIFYYASQLLPVHLMRAHAKIM